jgi:oxygen-independent coproporphyrinogen-3 oxidase
MRCGFCNLFTTANPKGDLAAAYLDTLRRQARRVGAALGRASFARLAIGGGTPTYLEPAGLHALFNIAERIFGVDPSAIPISVETSPDTADRERLGALRERGVDRISIGVQSFIEAEVHAAGRAQRTATVERALDRIRAAGFPTLNIDLIYGLPGQTVESWLASLRAALRFAPEELFLYPLYVRPLTGLGRRGLPPHPPAPSPTWGEGEPNPPRSLVWREREPNLPLSPSPSLPLSPTREREPGGEGPDDLRLACYRAARELLLDAGYVQVSMRMFRAAHAPAAGGPAYCCQEDGMVGLGCGARSYTHGLHYSDEYAVGATGVRAILADYIARPDQAFDSASYGVQLGPEDQRRRYVIQSLLQAEGLALDAYHRRFGAAALDELPELRELPRLALAALRDGRLQLTEAGLERSDAIGPWLYSTGMRGLMEEYELR